MSRYFSDPVQAMFRYADPIFVAAESIQRYVEDGRCGEQVVQRLQTAAWWDLLLTTRVLLAHIGLHDVGELVGRTVIANIRILLLLAGIEIGVKKAFAAFAGGNVTWIREGISYGGSRRLHVRSACTDAELLAELSPVSLATVQRSFELDISDPQMSPLCEMFGKAAFRLVATRDSGWESAAHRFAI